MRTLWSEDAEKQGTTGVTWEIEPVGDASVKPLLTTYEETRIRGRPPPQSCNAAMPRADGRTYAPAGQLSSFGTRGMADRLIPLRRGYAHRDATLKQI